MRLIKPSFQILEQQTGLEGVYKQIELAGRTCYKSEDRITEDSAKEFVDRMIRAGHGAMLEHGTVYLKKPITMHISDNIVGQAGGWEEKESYDNKYNNNPYSHVVIKKNLRQLRPAHSSYTLGYVYITTNLRVLVENNWLDDLKYICEPTEFHEKRITVRFICDRGISHKQFVA